MRLETQIEKGDRLQAMLSEQPVGLVPDTYIHRATGCPVSQVLWYRDAYGIARYRPTRCKGSSKSPLVYLGHLLAEKGDEWAMRWASTALDKGLLDVVSKAIEDRATLALMSKPSRGNKDEKLAFHRSSKTYSAVRLSRDEILAAKQLVDVEINRPKTRSECINGLRPCPYASCKYNLYSDVSRSGSLIVNQRDLEDPSELTESCALDVADRGGATLEEVGSYIGLTRERVRQIEEQSLDRLRKRGIDLQPY